MFYRSWCLDGKRIWDEVLGSDDGYVILSITFNKGFKSETFLPALKFYKFSKILFQAAW